MSRCFILILLTFTFSKHAFAIGPILPYLLHLEFKERGHVNCHFIGEQTAIQNESLEDILGYSPCEDLPGLPKIEQFKVKLNDKSFENQAKIRLIDSYVLYSLDYIKRHLSKRHAEFEKEISYLDEYIEEGEFKPINTSGTTYYPAIEEMFQAVNTSHFLGCIKKFKGCDKNNIKKRIGKSNTVINDEILGLGKRLGLRTD